MVARESPTPAAGVKAAPLCGFPGLDIMAEFSDYPGMDARFLHSYARVLLGVGLDLQRGQNLRIKGEPVHRDFMLILAEEAYRAGARAVRMDYVDQRHTRIRADHLETAHLEYVPGYVEKELQSYLDEDWALLSLEGQEDPELLDDADKGRLARMQQASSRVSHFFSLQVMANRLTWCVAPAPTRKWAEKVVGPGAADPVEELWKLLIPTLRLDREDPVAAWREHAKVLADRSRRLNEMRLDALRFAGPGTDLRIGLMPRSKFIGGSALSRRGITFIPNMPTEEVFSTPDFRRTEGTVACTRPVEVMGISVEDIRFTFAGGKLVGFDAGRGREALERFLSIDPNAGSVGEVALVGTDSPVYRSGRVFHSILFDENAACHIALGNGYPDAIQGGEELGEEELRALGCNISLVHTDFMISSPAVDLFGVTADGGERQIMSKGAFVQNFH